MCWWRKQQVTVYHRRDLRPMINYLLMFEKRFELEFKIYQLLQIISIDFFESLWKFKKYIASKYMLRTFKFSTTFNFHLSKQVFNESEYFYRTLYKYTCFLCGYNWRNFVCIYKNDNKNWLWLFSGLKFETKMYDFM